MKRLTKEEIKKIQLDMLSYIDEICLENNIKYTLVGGSLIGAIRHKGMIPWDDDIDIALTQEEYNKLMSILQNSTNSYVLLNHDINSKFYFPFTKIVYNKTLLKEQGFDYEVRIELEQCLFPEKTYGDMTFPAGTYDAVRVLIGQGKGKNFWCVLYPSLCYLDSTYAVVPNSSKSQLSALLSEDDFRALLNARSVKIR